MTDAEAIKAWMEHDPWTRASKELVQRIQRINNTDAAAKKFDALVEEVGEAP
jgi:hypothetical protein